MAGFMGVNVPVSKDLPFLEVILILNEDAFLSDCDLVRHSIWQRLDLAGCMQHQFEDTQCGPPFVVDKDAVLPDYAIVELSILQCPNRHIEGKRRGYFGQKALIPKRTAQAL